MSNPSNPLAAYRSYSYYHVLCMCDSTQTADVLSKTADDLAVWDHATSEERVGNTPDLGPYSVKCITDADGKNAGKYVVLINGSTDATYVITSAKWTTVTAGTAVPGDRGTSIAIEGSIQVSEPKGVAFLDQIVKCSQALGVDASQIVYVVKTFFVGHLDQDGIKQLSTSDLDTVICDIEPINCIACDVTGSFTEAGGVYEMQFVSIAHGAARLPQYSKLNDTISITAGATLRETLSRLQDEINREYNEYYDSLSKQFVAAGATSEDVTKLLRRVKYVIDVGSDYQDSRYTVTDQPAQYKNKGNCSEPAQIMVRQSTSIEAAISNIMQMSLQVKEDMSAGPEDKRYEYKIHTAVESVRTDSSAQCSADSQFDYTVYYRVERFPTPKSLASSQTAFEILTQDNVTEQTMSDPQYSMLNNNIIRFDYLYTGHNTDILEFEMKINYGLAYLQTATQTNTFKTQLDRSAPRINKPATDDANSITTRFGSKVPVPVFFGTQLKPSMVQSTQNPSTTIDSQYTLAKHSSIEVLDSKVKIMGNPDLLGMINRTTSANYIASGAEISDEQFGGWAKVPMFAHIKVKMPRNNDDFDLFSGGKDHNKDYADDFWFDGYYYIAGIEHTFENGEFSQLLELIGLPKKGAFKAAQGTVAPTINPSGSNDSTIPCAPTRAPTPESTAGAGRGMYNPPFVRPGEDGSPTNKADAQTSTENKDLSSVPGWNSASSAVKSAILNAANQYGISPVTLATVISTESSFNPTARPPKGTALGLGQFIEGTWLAQCKKDPNIGVDTGAPRSVQLAQRTDPVLNARATASYIRDNMRAIGSTNIGDVYLAHFMGVGVAKRVIAADQAGNGKLALRDAYVQASPRKGGALFESALSHNASIINSATTCEDIRTWAYKKMSLNGLPTKVAKRTTPSTPVSTAKTTRTARDAVASSIDCTVQQKKDTQPCGPTQDKI